MSASFAAFIIPRMRLPVAAKLADTPKAVAAFGGDKNLHMALASESED